MTAQPDAVLFKFNNGVETIATKPEDIENIRKNLDVDESEVELFARPFRVSREEFMGALVSSGVGYTSPSHQRIEIVLGVLGIKVLP